MARGVRQRLPGVQRLALGRTALTSLQGQKGEFFVAVSHFEY